MHLNRHEETFPHIRQRRGVAIPVYLCERRKERLADKALSFRPHQGGRRFGGRHSHIVMNTFGKRLTLTTFGESHGPPWVELSTVSLPVLKSISTCSTKLLQNGAEPSPLVTARNEKDHPEFLSGITPEGITLGTPIGFIVRNTDHHSSDYDEMAHLQAEPCRLHICRALRSARPQRGGRSSARETVNWVVAGALAEQWIASKGIKVEAVLSQVGS